MMSYADRRRRRFLRHRLAVDQINRTTPPLPSLDEPLGRESSEQDPLQDPGFRATVSMSQTLANAGKSVPSRPVLDRSATWDERFAQACRVPPDALLDVQSPRLGLRFQVPLNQGVCRIGRHPRSELSLPYELVMRHHWFLTWVDGHLYRVDLSQPNQRGSWWPMGQSDSLGPFELTWSSRAIREQRLSRQPADLRAREEPALILRHLRSSGEQDFAIRRRVTLFGPSQACQVRIQDVGLASIQVALIRTDRAAWLINLCENDQAWLNGSSFDRAELDPGDELRVGSAHFTFVLPWLDVASEPLVHYSDDLSVPHA
jgi:hypothetical protein